MVITSKAHNGQDVLAAALEAVNRRFKGNITFRNRFRISASRERFTLGVESSKGPGGRLSHSGRRIAAACWHVHGHFFDAVFQVDPEAVIRTGRSTVTKEAGNWEDWNIGSRAFPMYYSEACECDEAGPV